MATNRSRWLLISLLMTGLLLQYMLWFQPAPLLPTIVEEYGISYTQSGLIMSIICLLAALLGPAAGIALNYFGLKNMFTIAMALLALGSAFTFLTQGYYTLLGTRILIGIGIGLSLPLEANATVSWFSERERPFINTFYAILPYIATALNFILAVRVFELLGQNWRLTLSLTGFMLFLIVLAWLYYKEKDALAPVVKRKRNTSWRKAFEVLKDKQTRLICLADVCDMWGFQFLSSYLAVYLFENGLSMEKASDYAAIFPVAGIIAGLLCGALMIASGKRKIFTWPLHLAIFAGTLMIVYGHGFMQLAGIFLAGFGNAGWAPALYTMPMEFKNMTTEKISMIFALMLSLGLLAAFISPPLGGKIAGYIGLKATMSIFAFFALAAAALTFSMDETSPQNN